MNISGPAAVAKPEMLFYAPGDLTVTREPPLLSAGFGIKGIMEAWVRQYGFVNFIAVKR